MRLEQSFTVAAPIDEVWTALLDVEQVASCLPGAEVTGRAEDGSYEGTFTVKLGPTTAAYKGSLRLESADEDTHTATLDAKGSDKRGQGGANATIVATLREDAEGTVVDVASEFEITGRLARFGRSGMMEDVTGRLLESFATCLQSKLAPHAARPVAAIAADARSRAHEPVALVPDPDPEAPAPAAPAPAAVAPASDPEPPAPTPDPEPAPAAESAPDPPESALAPVPEPAPEPVATAPPSAPDPPPASDPAVPTAPARGPDPFGPIGPTTPLPGPEEQEEEPEPPKRESVPPPSMARQAPPPVKPASGLGSLVDRLRRLLRRR